MNRIEPLENRRLLAGVDITFSTDKFGGIVRIAGTNAADVVSVSLLGQTQFQITDGTTTRTFEKAAVQRLTFIGGGGNDNITLGRVQLKAYLDGGVGNDSLSASTGDFADTLVGGEGNDYCYAGPGNDSLDGGNGGDFLIGNSGDDFLQTKSEVNTDDTVSGGRGNDTVSLTTYTSGTTTTIGKRNPGLQLVITDTCYGDIENFIGSSRNDTVIDFSNRSIRYNMGRGDDQVYAGLGNDTIIGGEGKDSIAGDAGDDRIIGGIDNAIDSIVGGEGDDWAYFTNQDIVKQVESPLTSTGSGNTVSFFGPDGELIENATLDI